MQQVGVLSAYILRRIPLGEEGPGNYFFSEQRDNEYFNMQNLDKAELYHFKVFLDTKGADLANTTEFLSYYALPYVPNPLEHPSFKHIFTKDWMHDVRKKLESFLSNTIPQDSAPLLMKMYHVYTKSDARDSVTDTREKDLIISEKDATIAQLENSNKELLGILNEFNVKYGNLLKNYNIVQKNEEIARNNLFESHNKWINFAKELLAISKDVRTSWRLLIFLFFNAFRC